VNDEVPARLAAELDRRGLTEPARLLIEAHRPIAPLLSDLGAALAPLVRLGIGRSAPAVESLMADEAALDRVLAAIEARGEPDAQPR
jgi:hypothetical protein